MRVYVANCSVQERVFMYRVQEQTTTRRVHIRPMAQEILPDEFGNEQISVLVAQQEMYGFPSVQDIVGGRGLKQETHLCYAVDKPVSSLIMERVVRANTSRLVKLGKEVRKETAMASSEILLNQLKQAQRQGLDANITNIRQEIVEEEPKGGFDRPTSEVISEGFKTTLERKG